MMDAVPRSNDDGDDDEWPMMVFLLFAIAARLIGQRRNWGGRLVVGVHFELNLLLIVAPKAEVGATERDKTSSSGAIVGPGCIAWA